MTEGNPKPVESKNILTVDGTSPSWLAALNLGDQADWKAIPLRPDVGVLIWRRNNQTIRVEPAEKITSMVVTNPSASPDQPSTMTISLRPGEDGTYHVAGGDFARNFGGTTYTYSFIDQKLIAITPTPTEDIPNLPAPDDWFQTARDMLTLQRSSL